MTAADHPRGESSARCMDRGAQVLAISIRWATWLLFLFFCVRLLFTSLLWHGLPGAPALFWFWGVVGVAGILSFAFPAKSPLVFLAAFPLINACHEAHWIPVANLAPILFAVLFSCWLARYLLLRASEPADLLEVAVNSLALAIMLSAIGSLLHPSVSNSFSVAFAIPSWPEKTEFSGFTVGFNATAGCILFGMLRSQSFQRYERSQLLAVALIQVLSASVLAFGELSLKLIHGDVLGRNLVSLPFGLIHNLGGPACLFAGFFVGWTAVRWRRGESILLPAGFAIVSSLLVFISVSKGAWISLVALLIVVSFWWKGWKAGVLLLLAVVAAGGVLRFTILKKPPQDAVGEHLSAVVSSDQWARNGTLTERLEIWKKSVAIIAAQPFSGVGMGAFSSVMEYYGSPSFTGSKRWEAYMFAERHLDVPDEQLTFNGFHSHNDLLEIAAGAGLPTVLLLLAIVAGLLIPAFAKDADPLDTSTMAGAFALIGFAGVSMIDSRLISFPDNLLFWQFATFLALPRGMSFLPLGRAWIPVLAPLSVVLGMGVAFATGAFPRDQTYGVWNWRLGAGPGQFLLAKTAQFVVPPEEPLRGLAFRLPDTFLQDQTQVRVHQNGKLIANVTLYRGKRAEVLIPARSAGRDVILIESDSWAGRGALGSPFGVKPYSIIMQKVRD